MIKKKPPINEIARLENQLRVLEAMIEETKKAIKSLNPKSPKVQAP